MFLNISLTLKIQILIQILILFDVLPSEVCQAETKNLLVELSWFLSILCGKLSLICNLWVVYESCI